MPAKYYTSKKSSASSPPRYSSPTYSTPIKATGQFSPGALSNADPRTQKVSVGTPITTRFTQNDSGRIGTIVNNTPQLSGTSEIGMSPAFAAKYAQSTQPQTLDFSGRSLPADSPFLAQQNGSPFLAQQNGLPAPPPFVPNAAVDARGQQQPEGLLDNLKAQIMDNPLSRFVKLSGGRQNAILATLPLLGNLGMLSGSMRIIGSETTVNTALKVGTRGLVKGAEGTAGRMAVNSATAKATTSWFSKIAAKFGTPQAALATVAGGLMAAVGSYPFAGFIKEEALQTVGFAVTTAYKNKDVEGMRAALLLNDEILNPNLMKEIISYVPIANVVSNLNDFYKGAQLNQRINTQMFNDLQVQQETGESDAQKWIRVKQQEDDDKRASIDYYNSERERIFAAETEVKRQLNEEFNAAKITTEKQILAARSESSGKERAARRRQMEEEAKFWAEQKLLMFKLEEEERIRQAAFWLEYKKTVLLLEQKAREEQGRSTLHFGLLR